MSVYTKKGDSGMTDLFNGQRVNKTDLHIETLGNIDELTSAVGIVRSMTEEEVIANELLSIQKKLKDIMAVVASDFEEDLDVRQDTLFLEQAIDRNQALFPPLDHFIFPGDLRLSAQIDLARTIARRAERRLTQLLADKNIHTSISRYINRLSDYLFVLARMLEFREVVKQALDNNLPQAGESTNEAKTMTLDFAKELAEAIEKEAKRMGVNVVISIANKDGISILTQMMDNAFIVSKGLAEKKAYTSAALQMPTHALKELVKEGASFEGLEDMLDEKIVTLGGGYPLKNKEVTYGAIGVSGSSADNDIYLASYGASKTERKSV